MARLQITAVRLSGGAAHENISHVFGPAFGERTTEEAVDDIESRTHSYFVIPGAARRAVAVRAVRPAHHADAARVYLRTHANGVYTDSLLTLPRR
jgi:hypothetical protein